MIGRWLATRTTQVAAPKASITHSPRVPLYRLTVKPGRVTHAYTARAPLDTVPAWPLAWDAAEGAISYRVKRGTSPGVYTTSVDVGNVLTYLVTNDLMNVDYYYTVAAWDGVIESLIVEEAHFRNGVEL